MNNELSLIEKEEKNLGGRASTFESDIQRHNATIDFYASSIKGHRERILYLEDKIQKKMRKDQADKLVRAKAAAYSDKIRSGADAVKGKLHLTEYCPYCMILLGDDFEADHIMPVSYGGLSIVENMINVCRPCNRFKKNYDFTGNVRKKSS